MQWGQFAWNANPVFLEEWKNISKCRLLKTTQNVKCYGLHKQIAHGSVHGKTYNKTCTKRQISLHTLSLHISSLIRAFANRMYLLQSMGLTKCLVRWAKTRVNLRNCIFWSEHSLIVFNFDSRDCPNRDNQCDILIRAFADRTVCTFFGLRAIQEACFI